MEKGEIVLGGVIAFIIDILLNMFCPATIVTSILLQTVVDLSMKLTPEYAWMFILTSLIVVIVEYFITGLRLLEGLSTYDLEKRLDTIIPETVLVSIKNLYKSGLLNIEDEAAGIRVSLSEEGLYFADSVIYQVVESIL